MSVLKWIERQISGKGASMQPSLEQSNQQCQPQFPFQLPKEEQQQCLATEQEHKRQQRQNEKAEAKAAAAELRKQARQSGVKPPEGPCGRPCQPPSGGNTQPLPLATALQKNQPPWYAKHSSDLSLVQLLAPHDVLRVHYPAGSSTPSSPIRGGVQLRGHPRCLPARDVLLRFSFATASNFDWTRGGKLGGGLQVGSGAAAGYRHSDTAASSRLTWGPDGYVMLYIYQMEGTEQDPSYTKVARLGYGCGDHMFPDTFKVQQAVWNDVVMRVRLNTPGQADGVAGLGVNGQYREFDRMVWRLDDDTMITTALLVTFFGGSWSTPVDTSIDFANFSITVLE